MKKIISLLILCLILFRCQNIPEDDIYIFFTSDVHCGIEDNFTLSSLKSLVDDTKLEHPYVSLVDLGDYIQGSTIGTLSKGKYIIDIMNEMNYDIATIGNHEFDYGIEELAKRMNEANFEIVASNIIYSGNNKNIFEDIPEYIIKEYGRTKVAYIGIMTPTSIISSTPSNFMENNEIVYNFYPGNNCQDLYDKIQSLVDEVRNKGAKYVIALSHLGSLANYAPYDSISLIHNTSGIDVVLDGHSHSMIIEDKYLNKNNEDVILSSVGTKLESVGQLIISKDGTINTIHIDSYDKHDENIDNEIKIINEKINSLLDEKICELDFDLKMFDDEGIRMSRSRETTIGDFMADAFKEILDADIAFINGGGIRNGFEKGDITYNELLKAMPFQNEASLIKASGKEIISALEYGARFTEYIYSLDGKAVGEFGGLLIPSGLKYTIDTSIESSVISDENEMFISYDENQARVKDVYVLDNNEYVPIDLNKEYKVAGINYVLVESGDGNTSFNNSEILIENGEIDTEIIKQYLIKSNGFNDKYKEIEGRIIIE